MVDVAAIQTDLSTIKFIVALLDFLHRDSELEGRLSESLDLAFVKDLADVLLKVSHYI